MSTFELFRRSSIGLCLIDTLDEMVCTGILSPNLANQVLIQFDKSMVEALEAQVENKISIKVSLSLFSAVLISWRFARAMPATLAAKAHLRTYRFYDSVWTFVLKDAVFKDEEIEEQVKRVKTVAYDSKLLA